MKLSDVLSISGILSVIAIAALIGAGCGGETESTSAPETTTEDAASPTDDAAPPDGRPETPIMIESPATFASVHGSFELAGTAIAHEGELRWEILDEHLKPMASGPIEVSCGAPCRGNFSTTIKLDEVPVGSWELHVFQPPIADEDEPRVNDTILPITVTPKPVDDQPAADAPPPGGVPSDL